MALMPTEVQGIFTMMFGARLLNSSAWSASASASRCRRGSVWMERRPLRPLCSMKMGSKSCAASTDMSLMACHPMWDSPQVGLFSAMTRMRSSQTSGCFLIVV